MMHLTSAFLLSIMGLGRCLKDQGRPSILGDHRKRTGEKQTDMILKENVKKSLSRTWSLEFEELDTIEQADFFLLFLLPKFPLPV